jgi:uncharacterized protein YggU (UPF0235/DUF167 family)
MIEMLQNELKVARAEKASAEAREREANSKLLRYLEDKAGAGVVEVKVEEGSADVKKMPRGRGTKTKVNPQ